MVRSALPIDDVLPEVGRALQARGRCVLQAEPGAGKTTQVPGYVLDELNPDGLVVVLEPRRVAALASARRVADERGVRLGGEVGVRIRHHRQESKDTRLLFVTEGILTRWLLDDPFLEGVGCVVLDEFHERNLHADLGLAFLKELLELRDDLLVVVMSATLDTDKVSAYLHDAPVVHSKGRSHPLVVAHQTLPRDARLADEAVKGVRQLMTADDDDGGDVLVFLPGARDIQSAVQQCQKRPLPDDAEAVALYGALPEKEQDRVLRARPRGERRRRAIFATNIAETSLTLDGVTSVVDSGYEKRLELDAGRGLNALVQKRISRASADQRAGRAGRQAPGRCLRLWGKAEHAQLHAHIQPELLRTDVVPVALWCLGFAARPPSELDLLDAIPDANLQTALQTLHALDLVDDHHQLTSAGKAVVRLPVHPRVGCCLLGAKGTRVEDDMLDAAALLEEEDPLPSSSSSTKAVDCDLTVRLDLLHHQPGQLKRRVVERLKKNRRQLASLTASAPTASDVYGDAWTEAVDMAVHPLATALLAGFSDRVCRRRQPDAPEAQMATGQGVVIDERRSQVRGGTLFLALSVRGGGKNARVDMASLIDEDDLRRALPDAFHVRDEGVYDDDKRQVFGVKRTWFHGLLFDERSGGRVSDDDAARLLLEKLRDKPAHGLTRDDDVERCAARLRFAADHLGGDVERWRWPASDDDWVDLVEPSLWGLRSMAEVKKVDLDALLLQRLDYNDQRLLDDKVPDRVQVPSGSRLRVDYRCAYGAEGSPVLEVRLQEMFGCTATPTVAGVPLRLHLLAPNQRPAAITQDLAGFWQGSYAEVRKELRRRYPKHSWPEDASTAAPERRPQRRRR